jgi:acyl-coenzyme A thioesterase PaaI-like protein
VGQYAFETMKKELELLDDRHCIVCGEKNQYGLKLVFNLEGNILKTKFKPDKRFQGYRDILHGGIIGLILDEMIVNLPWKLGMKAVTAEYTVRLKKPVLVGDELEFTSRIIEDKGKLLIVEAEARKTDSTVVATCYGKCIKI